MSSALSIAYSHTLHSRWDRSRSGLANLNGISAGSSGSSPFFLSTEPATQATLRRTVSTAYYALFHLLVEDACQLWAQATHRGKLSRQFEHRRMNLETAVTRVVCS